jgi:hypothetical protein
MKPTPPVDRRETFAARPRPKQSEPDLIVTIRQPKPHARWVARRAVILSSGKVKP